MFMMPQNLRSAIYEVLPYLRGWSGKTERPYRMAQLIVNEKPETIVEIGVFGGQSLVPQAMALKSNGKGRIYGVDPFNLEVITQQLADMDDKPMWLKQDMNTVLIDTFQMIKQLGLQNHAVLVLGDSKDCATLFPSIDILHVDGAHTEEGALSDVNLYAKRVRKGGFVWMDDTHFPSLQPALKELETFCKMVDDWNGYRLYQHK